MSHCFLVVFTEKTRIETETGMVMLCVVSSLCLLCRKDRERDPRDRERDSYRSVTTFAEKKDYRESGVCG